MNSASSVMIELTVNNHPGVMSHITGLFSRRAFNLEGILCTSLDNDHSRSSVFLLVEENGRINQVVQQLFKLHDVLGLSMRAGVDRQVFGRLHEFLRDPTPIDNNRCFSA